MKQVLFSGIDLDHLLAEVRTIVQEEIRGKFTDSETKEKLLTREQAAQALHITLTTLHNRTKEGKIKANRLGSRVLYKESEILKALD